MGFNEYENWFRGVRISTLIWWLATVANLLVLVYTAIGGNPFRTLWMLPLSGVALITTATELMVGAKLLRRLNSRDQKVIEVFEAAEEAEQA